MPEIGKEKKKYVPRRYTKEQMEEITKQIDERLHDFIKEGKYKEVLISMGNLGKYSLNNQIYILIQNPDAKTVHGLRKWNSLGRHVIPRSKGIKIFSPILKEREKDITDEDGCLVLDKDGNPKKEKKLAVVGYEQAFVFDISQTEGKELDVFKFDEDYIVENKDRILKGLKDVVQKEGFTISYASKQELGEGCYGLCSHLTHEIKILEGMPDLQEISTTVHECGHALAHSAYRKDFDGLTPLEKREIKEVEAESIACVVCTYLGLDTQNFNFSYITGWAEGDITKFRKNLDVISKHSKTLINGIEKELEEEKTSQKKEPFLPPLISKAKEQGMEMA